MIFVTLVRIITLNYCKYFIINNLWIYVRNIGDRGCSNVETVCSLLVCCSRFAFLVTVSCLNNNRSRSRQCKIGYNLLYSPFVTYCSFSEINLVRLRVVMCKCPKMLSWMVQWVLAMHHFKRLWNFLCNVLNIDYFCYSESVTLKKWEVNSFNRLKNIQASWYLMSSALTARKENHINLAVLLLKIKKFWSTEVINVDLDNKINSGKSDLNYNLSKLDKNLEF